MRQLKNKLNLIVTQKSIIGSWKEHFDKFYTDEFFIIDATKEKIESVMEKLHSKDCQIVILINYELLFRRKQFLDLKGITLICDESGLLTNADAKRTKFISKLNCENVILLSGTICGGKYENLWSQLHLLGWNISKEMYWNHYVDVEYLENQGFPIKVVRGYKNVERLKQKMRDYGCRFLKTDEVFELPSQTFQEIYVEPIKEYKKFRKDGIVTIDGEEIVGDNILTKMLCERKLCGQYNPNKLKALQDILESTDDRVLVFYNFTQELYKIEDLCRELDKPMSIVNGREKDLTMYNEFSNSVTAIQYQAGSMGLNLQLANKIVYFSPPLSSELFEQSKKRIHRIGQEHPCFYYKLICRNSIEEKIYEALAQRRDYTNELFEWEE